MGLFLGLVSVLNREPMGMKRYGVGGREVVQTVSVLNREPMGMKLAPLYLQPAPSPGFSAQPRADGDEAGLDNHD